MLEKFLSLLAEKNYVEIKKLTSEMMVQDIAYVLEEVEDPATLVKIFRLLPKAKCADVFSYMSSDLQETMCNLITDKELSYLLEEMFIDDTVDFIEEMPANVVKRILKNATPENRKEINQFLSYKEDSAGSIMTNEFLDIKKGTKIKSAINKIRKQCQDLETINCVYITDQKREIEGYITIRDLILADPDEAVENIMRDNVIFAYTSTDQEEIANLFKKYSIMVMPIVDKEKRLVGIVTVDDVVVVMQEEATEDIHKMAGITPGDKPYLKTNVFGIWLQRAPWLLLLMLSATLTSSIIMSNESVLSTGSSIGIILTASIPMIMNTGGNCGNQASATVIRGLTLDEIKFKDFFRVVWKELRVSIILGATLSVACFGKLLFIDRLYWQDSGILIALTVCIAMFATTIMAKLIGAMLPLIARKIKLDPAVMAAPLITTIVDALSLTIFCSIALSILPV